MAPFHQSTHEWFSDFFFAILSCNSTSTITFEIKDSLKSKPFGIQGS